MPAKSDKWWRGRLNDDDPCHYLRRADDAYAKIVREQGVRMVWPKGVKRVLDVGCGDGRVGAWMKREFGVHVTGVDPFRYKGVSDRLDKYYQFDAEDLAGLLSGEQFDLVTFHTVLCCVKDWEIAIGQACLLTDKVIVVENTQYPVPLWQRAHHQKTHLEYPNLIIEFQLNRFESVSAMPINFHDRRWLHKTPDVFAWPVALFTLLVDVWEVRRFLKRSQNKNYRIKDWLESCRYSAILFQKFSKQ